MISVEIPDSLTPLSGLSVSLVKTLDVFRAVFDQYWVLKN